MKYKLVNIRTKKETFCEKVTVDGFDYYVSNEKIEENNKVYFAGRILTTTTYNTWFLIWNFIELPVPPVFYKNNKHPLKIIATNNPNINIPKVVDEIRKLALTEYPEEWQEDNGCNYPQQEWDINKIEFHKWAFQQARLKESDLTTKELLQIWKEGRIKIVYYE